ncbi:kynureninase [Rhodococcus maanshanensis]|uniref:Kynureninase n=1 Tax=Rhodococcus maanshanensis TaxID=183556 RepID=A0A1H7UKK7_9NOCA|nr:aminotransferase class V-fold PLP-dependent enzyme [Rhodococcus maanshanensis]SEL97275.1 kynureninase [Rhodococcus maanshanensis]
MSVSNPVPQRFSVRAAELDDADPLSSYRDLFVDAPSVVSYLDGNSLGRPTKAGAERVARFVAESWGGRLIRGWDEEWFDLPLTVGDDLGRVVLGAAAGQTAVGDSTSVLLYKLARGAVALRQGRDEIVLDTDNFPTDRYVLEAVASELGMTLRWIESDPRSGVHADEVAAVVGDRTALVVLSHVAYRSGYLADAASITRIAHGAGALMLWDLCHSAGSVPIELDEWGVDLAVGCTYKYLNGGPGSPAFAYVRAGLLEEFVQPIWGWMGREDCFEMAPGYRPAKGIRRILSGTPAVLGMIAMRDTVELIDRAGIRAIRAKSVLLTEFALELVAESLVPLGVTVASPVDPSLRGGHVTIDHPHFRAVTPALWERGVIPDFRAPEGLRLGLSPLSTSFAEVVVGVEAIRAELAAGS